MNLAQFVVILCVGMLLGSLIYAVGVSYGLREGERREQRRRNLHGYHQRLKRDGLQP